MIGQDSKIYKDGEAPDLGSIKVLSNNRGIREYAFLQTDFSKLPTYCLTGSTAICVDTGEIYMFHEDTSQWYKQ